MLDDSAATTGFTPPNSSLMPNAAPSTSEKIENSTTTIDATYHSTVRERVIQTSRASRKMRTTMPILLNAHITGMNFEYGSTAAAIRFNRPAYSTVRSI